MASLNKFGRANVTSNVLTGAYAVIATGNALSPKVIDSLYISERSGAGTATTFNLQLNAAGVYSFIRFNQLFTNTAAYTDQAIVLSQPTDKLEIKSTANVDVVANYREFGVSLPNT